MNGKDLVLFLSAGIGCSIFPILSILCGPRGEGMLLGFHGPWLGRFRSWFKRPLEDGWLDERAIYPHVITMRSSTRGNYLACVVLLSVSPCSVDSLTS